MSPLAKAIFVIALSLESICGEYLLIKTQEGEEKAANKTRQKPKQHYRQLVLKNDDSSFEPESNPEKDVSTNSTDDKFLIKTTLEDKETKPGGFRPIQAACLPVDKCFCDGLYTPECKIPGNARS